MKREEAIINRNVITILTKFKILQNCKFLKEHQFLWLLFLLNWLKELVYFKVTIKDLFCKFLIKQINTALCINI